MRSKVAYTAYLFYKWDASVDPEYAPDAHGEAVNPPQIVAQAQQMIDRYGFESIKLKAGVFDPDEEADAVLALRAAFPTTHLAASVQHLSYACDTHYPWQQDGVLLGGKVPITGGCVHLTDKPGLGVELDHEKPAELHQAFLRCRIRTRNDVAQMQRFRPDWRQV